MVPMSRDVEQLSASLFNGIRLVGVVAGFALEPNELLGNTSRWGRDRVSYYYCAARSGGCSMSNAIRNLLLAPVGMLLTVVPPQERPPQIRQLEKQIAGREQLPAEQVFANIQIFKGMPAQRVLRVMELAFVPNLGVQCSHCHVEGNWASDDRPTKAIARGMWRLREETQEQVRKITGKPDVAVTCYTCHKGQPRPAFAPSR